VYAGQHFFTEDMSHTRKIAIQGIKGCFNEQALAAVKPLMTDLNILGEYESAI
jgi:hypothetical protein